MGAKSTESGKPTPLWAVLLSVPALVYGLFLIPSLGDFGEGLWPEWFGFQQKGSQGYGAFATDVRFWTIGTLSTAVVAALILWWSMNRNWRGRLRSFQVQHVLHYRRFLWGYVFSAFLCGVALGGGALLLSTALRTAAIASWVIFLVAVGMFAAGQFFCTVLGLTRTHRLFTGL